MLKNYLKIGWRNIRAGGFYSILNIGGLSIVLAVTVLLLWWVKDELTFDNFHTDADRIYRINSHFGAGADENTFEYAPSPLAIAAVKSVPGVESAVRVENYPFRTFRVNGKIFTEKANLGQIDEHFLNLFNGFKILYGNPAKPFPSPNSVILTADLAMKYFGATNAIGKTFTTIENNRTFTVAAVMANIPDNSSINHQMLFPMSVRKEAYIADGSWRTMDENWDDYGFEIFVKLSPGVNVKTVNAQFTAIKNAVRKKSEDSGDYRLQSLTEIHLYAPDGKNSGAVQVRMLGVIGLLLLSIGCINYVNLTTARATRRAREVGVRKVVGAGSMQLAGQLLTESLMTLSISLVLAILLIKGMSPLYGSITGKAGQFTLLGIQGWQFLTGTLLFTFVMAGIYPAMLVARFRPIQALQGRSSGVGDAGLRKGLVVLQFALATILISGTFVINRQLRYIRERDSGLSREHVFIFNGKDFSQQFKRELAGESDVISVSTSSDSPVNVFNATGGVDWDGKEANRMLIMAQISVDPSFIPNFDIKLAAGRNFDGNAADSTHFILNETAVKQAGIRNPIGKRFKRHGTEGTIIGVVKDFNITSIHEPIRPLVVFNSPESNKLVSVRTTGKSAKNALLAAEKLWKKYSPEYPFEFSFLEEDYDRFYKSEQKTAQLLNFFAGIAIVISCLGLLGLVSFTAEQRTKEIGIRKVLGATVLSITSLLSRDFMKLVVISILIASPIAWFALNKWLENFAYKIEIKWWMFAGAGLLAVITALLTISFQSLKAASANPVKSLRSQ
ncbi:ABC transporter permease [Dyadobacter arcticus]|uniref:ABC-type antimicrobial peptide transport system permease subunit n=1 Tax=Dyadobacter arcticus TaxID=1078754 RepID=A0ABX0UQG4_9BACT|nr:ABC transporter permease [Dyadobacter arcticus]NIJ53810.1 ABC-type antimicrobial peptide transport system permease subunit [Dyadobacter arcticus]